MSELVFLWIPFHCDKFRFSKICLVVLMVPDDKKSLRKRCIKFTLNWFRFGFRILNKIKND